MEYAVLLCAGIAIGALLWVAYLQHQLEKADKYSHWVVRLLREEETKTRKLEDELANASAMHFVYVQGSDSVKQVKAGGNHVDLP